MLEYFKNIADKNSCSTGAVCSIHPSVNSLYQVILAQLSEISFYAVKLNELGFENKSAYDFLVETLSIFLINTSFNQKKYLSLVLKLDSIRKTAKDKYLKYCKNNNLSFEIINKNLQINSATTISQLIEYSEKYNLQRQKNTDREKLRLFELVILIAKLSSINIVKLKKLKYDDSFDFKVLKFFSLTNSHSMKNEKIKKKILEFSHIALEIKNKLNSVQKEKFGQKESSFVNLALEEGYNVLVSGDDFDELDKVLKALENYKTSEKINVYTNGALFLANFYPYFKNNKFLKGHFGTENPEYDFSNFKGAILITQNFVQKIDSLYRGEIFSKKLISFTKVSDIENNNYTPLLDACLNFEKTTKTEKKEVKIEYNTKKLDIFSSDEIIIIIGKMNNKIEKNKTDNFVFLNSAIEDDILLKKIDEYKEKNIKTTIFFSECNLTNLNLLFVLLDYNFELYFVDCSNILINPYVIEALKEDFNIKII